MIIIKFDQFDQLNELNKSTYFNAAIKLRKLGGKHIDRASSIERHAYIGDSRDLGEFNIIAEIVEASTMNYLTKKVEDMFFVTNPNSTEESTLKKTKLVKSSPIPIYINRIYIRDPNEDYDDNNIDDCKSLLIMFWGIPSQEERVEELVELFGIQVPIIWEKGVFRISDDPLKIGDMSDGIFKFSDRKSAVKFRNKVLSKENLKKSADHIDKIREFFMEHSDATEWDKFFEKLRSININELYN